VKVAQHTSEIATAKITTLFIPFWIKSLIEDEARINYISINETKERITAIIVEITGLSLFEEIFSILIFANF